MTAFWADVAETSFTSSQWIMLNRFINKPDLYVSFAFQTHNLSSVALQSKIECSTF